MITRYRFPRAETCQMVLLALALVVSRNLVPAADYEWTFSQGNLNAALGNGSMTYADGAISAGLTSFGTTDGTVVPHIGGQAAGFLRVPAFAAQGNGYFLTFADSGANGGGSYLNQYTLVFDVLAPGSLDWTPFFNADVANNNDADFYVAPDGAVGIGALGYSSVGLVSPETWFRVAFSADLGAGSVSYYLNGLLAYQRTGGSLVDGRFSFYSNADPGPDVLLFNEGDTSGQYTHELLVSSVFFSDRTMSAQEIMALGGPNALGVLVPEPHTWACGALGLLGFAAWHRRRSRHLTLRP